MPEEGLEGEESTASAPEEDTSDDDEIESDPARSGGGPTLGMEDMVMVKNGGAANWIYHGNIVAWSSGTVKMGWKM